VILPEQYNSTAPYRLLEAAARGKIGIDHRFLHAILDRPAEAIPDLVRFAAEDRENHAVDLDEDLLAIFASLRTPEALPFYIGYLRRHSEDAPDELVEAVSPHGATALEPLLAVYEELGEEQGGEVAFVLAALGVRDPRILKLFIERLEYDASDAALLLQMYGDPSALPPIERLLDEIPQSDDWLRRQLTESINALKATGEQASEPSPPFDIWPLYAEVAAPRFDLLTENERLLVFDCASPELRAGAAASFVSQELSEEAQRRLLKLAQADPDPQVRGRAWEALSDALEDTKIRSAMLVVAEDVGAPVEERGGAVSGLAQESDDPRVRRAIEKLYEEPDGRAKALEAMWRSLDRTFAPYPVRHLSDPDPDVRRNAIWCIGHLKLTQDAPRLTPMFEDDEFRVDALFAYAMAYPGEVSRSRARSVLQKIEELANGLTEDESELVEVGIDQRLMLQGQEPVFSGADAEPVVNGKSKVGRNDLCPCGSGKKYKLCCGG
jgi:HEAT repeat protein